MFGYNPYKHGKYMRELLIYFHYRRKLKIKEKADKALYQQSISLYSIVDIKYLINYH